MPRRIGTLVSKLVREHKRHHTAHDENGHEKVDNTPIAPPVGFVKQPPLHELIRQMVKSEQLRQQMNAEAETFEEADDFEIGDYEPSSPYEEVFDPPLPPPSHSAAPPVAAGGSPAPTPPVDTPSSA